MLFYIVLYIIIRMPVGLVMVFYILCDIITRMPVGLMLPPGLDEEEPEEGVYRFTLLSPFDADELEVMFEVNPIIPLIPGVRNTF